MGIPQTNRESASFHLGRKIEDAEHFHSVWRDCILVVYDSDVPKTEGLDQSLHDLVMWNGAMCFSR
jgi:hypothetical protein